MDRALQGLLITLMGLAGTVITILTRYFIVFLKAKIEKLNTDKAISETYASVEEQNRAKYTVIESITAVVQELNGTIVKAYKVANDDGGLTDDEVEIIEKEALRIIWATMSEETEKHLRELFGSVDEWIETQIISIVEREKRDKLLNAPAYMGDPLVLLDTIGD